MLAGNPRVFKVLWEQLPVPNFVALALQLAPLLTANFPEPNLQLAPPLEPRVAAHHSIQLLQVVVPITVVWRHCLVAAELLQ